MEYEKCYTPKAWMKSGNNGTEKRLGVEGVKKQLGFGRAL